MWLEPGYADGSLGAGLGVGERLMHALMDGREHVRFALSAAPGMDAWYAKLGFVDDTRAMVRPRGRP